MTNRLLLLPGDWAKCDQHDCISVFLIIIIVCPVSFLKNHTSNFYQIFYTSYLSPWIGPWPLTTVGVQKFKDDFSGNKIHYFCV